ncbi:MAG TPA: TIGR03915 family putative DNA repair protein [Flavisolibacter sp.]|nr:TIGR03915 family putative DNA repair protein [Flavisolibacter sp.]
MQPLLYDGSFDGFLCAIFDVYVYKYSDATICKADRFNGNLFNRVHHVHTSQANSERIRKGLEKRISRQAVQELYYSFLSELPGIEDILLAYMQYAFASEQSVEKDFSHHAVLSVYQTAKKVDREKHRMEAFVRFQQTKDGLYYAMVEPDYNVLPVITPHFRSRYADQRWLIYDSRRHYGIYYDLETTSEVKLQFSSDASKGKDVSAVYDVAEPGFQQLWQQYFRSVNIAARKNTKLHLQHMPARYWKHLIEKRGA